MHTATHAEVQKTSRMQQGRKGPIFSEEHLTLYKRCAKYI